MQKINHKLDLVSLVSKLEDIILANSGTDAFDEIIKLFFTKIYIEKETEAKKWTKLKDNNYKINLNEYFTKAKSLWPENFTQNDQIDLPLNTQTKCLEILNKVELSGIDFRIIDAAFSQLMPKTAKGNRGQYLTPRDVIKEIVKVLNPKKDEYMLDPACGTGGFLLEAGRLLMKKGHKINLFGVDYDHRMIRLAKLGLEITGIKNSFLYLQNGLAPDDKLPENSFDIISANPPFGGMINDQSILQNYELPKRSAKKDLYAMRQTLFLERIISLLKPGGRAAIIVSQGILNNTNLNYIREWIYKKTRVIAVVTLEENTFKPYTTVRTSIIILQKWKDKPLNNYPVFMAISQKSGRDKRGKLIYKKSGQLDSDLPQIMKSLSGFINKELDF